MGEDGHPGIKFICKDCGSDMKCIDDERGGGEFLYRCLEEDCRDRRSVVVNMVLREMKI